MSPTISALDHLVLLVPSLESTSFLSGFDLHPGGTHADGLTANTLILLPDGVYIEVIAFTPSTTPEARKNHWWGQKADGFIDYSLNPLPETAQERVDDAPGVWDPPVAGGRETLDGKHLKWKVAFPVLKEGEKRGVIGFWCEDVTSRSWRVPERSEPHPNGATGISSLTLLSHAGKSSAYTQRLAEIFVPSADGAAHQFELSTPSSATSKIKLFVREPTTEEEKEWVERRGEGLWEVGVKVEAGSPSVGKSLGAENGARITFDAA